ncbi:MAG: hypothetical protein ISEC1_P0143 [Thiomicrorhabdus sp.]|nr:MAG: hypothetical protein ISEC1_P0143 [Thiomicrorhabdus sp.]
MSDVNIEKDDQATQEMLKMMGELSDEMDTTLQDPDAINNDALLDELEGLPDKIEIKTPEAVVAEPEDNSILSVDDIDSIMSEVDSDNKTEVDVIMPDPTDESSELETAIIDAPNDVPDELDIDALLDSGVEAEVETTAEAETEVTEDVADADELDIDALLDSAEETEVTEDMSADADIETDQIDEVAVETTSPAETYGIDTEKDASDEATEDASSAIEEVDQTTSDTNPVIEQTQQSIDCMEEAIQIDQEVHEIATQVLDTAQEATKLAIATSQKAHDSAEKTQEAIEATFTASEKAFEAAKNAGYSIDIDQLPASLSSPEIESQLSEVQEKNRRLKEINKSIKVRINELKS